MHLWQGKIYKDDRLFILDITEAKKDAKNVWAVVTRRNCEGFPPFRVDDFMSEEEAIKFIRRVEPTTPLISLKGQSPIPTPTYDDYCLKLRAIGLPSALEIQELNRNNRRQIIIDEVSKDDI